MRFLILIFLLLNSLYAHKLYILADDDGKTLHVKSYFTKSSSCQNCKVEIIDNNGKVLFKKKTNTEGEANFPFTMKNINIEVTASMGHKNSISYESENEVLSVEKNESYKRILLALGIIAFIFFILKVVIKK